MGDISPNFSRSEFSCRDSCGFDTVDAETILVVEFVREANGGIPITPSSGCRCAKHNKKIGGSKSSQHVKGRAVDLPCRNPMEVYKALCKEYPGRYGFGVYHSFVHVDTRSNGPARWSKISQFRSIDREVKTMKGYRTVIQSVLFGALTIAHGFGLGADVTEEQVGTAVNQVEVAIGAVWAIVAIFMRSITSTAVGKSE